jgi:hypothetical protein
MPKGLCQGMYFQERMPKSLCLVAYLCRQEFNVRQVQWSDNHYGFEKSLPSCFAGKLGRG